VTVQYSCLKDHSYIDQMFAPKSIAVIGASPDSHHTRNLLNGLRRSGYQGRVYPVNPSRSAMLGLRAYATIAELPEKADLAAILLPALSIPKILQEVAASGCRAAYILASGFEDPSKLSELRKIAEAFNIMLLGPNCDGYVNSNAGIHLWVGPLLRPYKPGALALVGHSSGVLASTINSIWERNLGISWMISLGNEAIFRLSDALGMLAADLDTKVVVCYVEAFGDYIEFFESVKKCRDKGIAVIVVAVGLSEIGRRVALSHTGSVTTKPVIAKAAIEGAGALQAGSMDEALDFASLFAQLPRHAWRSVKSVGVFSISGGFCALAADIFERQRLTFPDLSKEIKTLLPEGVAANNPLDLTGRIFAWAERYPKVADAFVESEAFDAVIALFGAWERYFERWFAPVMAWAYRANKPVIMVGVEEMGVGENLKALLEHQPMPIIQGVERSARGLKAMQRWHEWQAYLSRESMDRAARWEGGEIETILGMETTLRQSGLDVSDYSILADCTISGASYPDLGYRCVVKLESRELPHKTEYGAVKITSGNYESIEASVKELKDVIARLQLKEWSIIGQPFIESSLELLVGVVVDERFGPIMTVGLGGTLVELLDTRVQALCPFSELKAESLVRELNIAPLLEGYRGRPPLNVDSLCKALTAISHLAWRYREDLIELDLNPLMVGSSSTIVVDALAKFKDNANRVRT
jgi:acyl-CoA synthetase (NDP forming)